MCCYTVAGCVVGQSFPQPAYAVSDDINGLRYPPFGPLPLGCDKGLRRSVCGFDRWNQAADDVLEHWRAKCLTALKDKVATDN